MVKNEPKKWVTKWKNTRKIEKASALTEVHITATDDASKMAFIKHDGGKPSWSTMPQFEVLDEVAQVGAGGAKKYALYNWQKADKLTRYIDAAYRHLNAFAWKHEDINEADFGLSHLAHAVWCLLTVMWMMKYRPETDDRFMKERKNDEV